MDSTRFHHTIESLLDHGEADAARALCVEALTLARADADRRAEAEAELKGHGWAAVAAGVAVTVSIGVATSGATRSIDDALTEAVAHLYPAKRGGRHCAVACAPPETLA